MIEKLRLCTLQDFLENPYNTVGGSRDKSEYYSPRADEIPCGPGRVTVVEKQKDRTRNRQHERAVNSRHNVIDELLEMTAFTQHPYGSRILH